MINFNIKTLSGLALLIWLTMFSRQSFAWEPCLPFCDRNCAGRALDELGQAVSSQLQGLAQTCQELTLELNNTTQAFSDLVSDYGVTRVENQAEILRAVDAVVIRQMLNIDTNAAYLSSLADNFVQQFAQLVPDIARLKRLTHNAETLGRASRFDPPAFEKPDCEECESDVISQYELGLAHSQPNQVRLMQVILNDAARTNRLKTQQDDLDFITHYQLDEATQEPAAAEALMRLISINYEYGDILQRPMVIFSAILEAKALNEHYPYTGWSFEQMLSHAQQNSLTSPQDNQAIAGSTEHEVLLRNLYQLQVKNASLMALVEQQERDGLLEIFQTAAEN